METYIDDKPKTTLIKLRKRTCMQVCILEETVSYNRIFNEKAFNSDQSGGSDHYYDPMKKE